MAEATALASVAPFRAARRAPTVRLLCLPFAGGGAASYRAWSAGLPDAIDVCAIELPGRGTRFRDRPIADMNALVDELLPAVAPLFDLPVAFYGHSMGASIALALARRAPALGAALAHVFAAGAPAPSVARASMGERWSRLSDPALVAKLRELGGTPPEILEHVELMELALPILRSDLALLESFDPAATPQLPCTLTAFAGTRDEGVPLADVRAWHAYAGARFELVSVPGGHFFLNEPLGQATIFDVIARSLLR